MGPDSNEIKDGTFYVVDENGEAHMAFSFPIGYVELVEESESDNTEQETGLRNLYLDGTMTFSGTITKKSARKLQRFFKKGEKNYKRYVRRNKFRRMIRKIFKRGE